MLEKASSDAVWHSAIGELEVRVDLNRHDLASLELPGWGQGFQLYVTRVPGRSIVLFERFELRKNETEVIVEYIIIIIWTIWEITSFNLIKSMCCV